MKKKIKVYPLFDEPEKTPGKKKRAYHRRTPEERARDERLKAERSARKIKTEEFMTAFKSSTKIYDLTTGDVAAALVKFFEQKVFYKVCDYIMAYPHLNTLYRFIMDTSNPYNEVPELFKKFVMEARQRKQQKLSGITERCQKPEQNVLFADEDIAEENKRVSDELLLKDEVWYS